MPSWDLFDALPKADRDAVLAPSVPARPAVEAGATQGWHRYVGDAGDVIGSAHRRRARQCCANMDSLSTTFFCARRRCCLDLSNFKRSYSYECEIQGRRSRALEFR